jgi:hypothetical protein
MRTKLLMACSLLLLAGCAEDSRFRVPLSTDDPPPSNATRDSSCMQDCLADGSNPGFCHDRCAK